LRGLRRANRRSLDVGVVEGPWGKEYFLESAGVGIFADLLHAYSPEQSKSLLRAMKSAVSVMAGYHAREVRLALDDVGFSGRYLLVEAMNTPYLGMRNRLAPEADPTDGRLDVVLVPEDERLGLAAFITQAVAGKVASMPNVTVRQAQRLRLEWDGVPIHGDEAVRVGDDAGASPTVPVEIETLRGALEVWIPAVHAVPVS
ncbi:MAG: diacylglycerol/lipid kinase family protein, partial [bacterium]